MVGCLFVLNVSGVDCVCGCGWVGCLDVGFVVGCCLVLGWVWYLGLLCLMCLSFYLFITRLVGLLVVGYLFGVGLVFIWVLVGWCGRFVVGY